MSRHITKDKINSFIRNRDFKALFIELGWDLDNLSPSLPLDLPHNDPIQINRIVQKRGFVICLYDAGENYPTTESKRRQIVNQLTRHHYEHLLIICGSEGRQCWTVAIRPQNRPLRTVEKEWDESQDIQPLMEKLNGMIFDISEEETLGITDVVDRVRSAFMEGAEKITKKFYREFKSELLTFAEFIEGINKQVSREWYAALMLNRLMFIYFIQKKRFLNGEVNYLENRLNETQKQFGPNKFHDRFYRHFLIRLFSEGLGAPESARNPKLKEMLGKVPYLNGGLFDVHQIEHENEDIQIPDHAFKKLFAFFNQYNWHLDSRPEATGKDINPDVIGYIFEKYINDRAAMGAYYTQEDITGYIARNTIIPFLLHRAREKCKNAFDATDGIWRFLRENPDNYIYDAVKKGGDIPDEEIPENIRRGMDTNQPNLIERRKDWNTPTDKKFALPTETWRETIARRQRYFDLKDKIKNGEVHDIDDLVTYNLDIERFAADALSHYEGSDFIDAFFAAIADKKALRSNHHEQRGITVLDPACGSGAFLFAALNILEPLYGKCIERMKDFVEEDDKQIDQKRKNAKKHPHFRDVLEDIDRHQNEKYWIYKTIILNNLYGVDLMKEAAEIAKLRLFLKLAAEAEYDPSKNNLGLEPLPDIDFNIRSGNSLVGFASMAAFEKSVTINDESGQRLLDISDGLISEIGEDARLVQAANDAFRQAQDSDGGEGYQQAKRKLSDRLAVLNDKMNKHLAREYGEKNDKPADYKEWQQSHQPFHWVAEFYGIIENGAGGGGGSGFDVVIGNPPYVEYSTVRKTYTVKNYETESCGNLYAMFIERAIDVSNNQIGMIVQLPLVCTDRMLPARSLFNTKGRTNWFANFDDRPGKLFSDLQHIRASIFLSMLTENKIKIRSTKYQRWLSKNRNILFQQQNYGNINVTDKNGFPKIGEKIGLNILRGLKDKSVFSIKEKVGESLCYYHNSPQYWIRATDFVPYFWNERYGEKQSDHIKNLRFKNHDHAIAECAVLNSSIFYWWFIVHSNCRDLNMREIENFPFDPNKMKDTMLRQLSGIVEELMESYRKNSVRNEASYRTTGKVVYDEFYPRYSKSIIDKIDTLLAKHYHFTEEELDYIINYDIKYRMGLGNG